MKRIISFFSAAVMLLSLLPCAAAEENTYIYLQSAADIKDLADQCVIDSYSTRKTVVLSGDIDVSSIDFDGIPYFNGVFDGGGHTISGINIELTNPERGFIGIVGDSGIVKNLNINAEYYQDKDNSQNGSNEQVLEIIENLQGYENSGVKRYINDTDIYTAGGIAGINKGLISGCVFEGSLSISKNAGGIAGINEGRIEACTNYASVESRENTGGIAGRNSGVIKWSKNYGKINNTAEDAMYATGGVAGYSEGIIEVCENNAGVGYKNAGIASGGICGVQSGHLSECINTGEVLGKTAVGGITGNFEPYTNITYNSDEWSDRINEQKDKLRGDLDSIEARIDDRRQKIRDDFDEFDNDVRSFFNTDRFYDSMEDMHDDIRSDFGSVRNDLSEIVDIAGKAEEDLFANSDEVRNFLIDARDSAKTMADAVDTISQGAADSNDHIIELIDTVNSDLKEGDISKTLDSLDKAINATADAMDSISDMKLPDISVDILSDTDNQIAKALSKINRHFDGILEPYLRINNAFNEFLKELEDRKKVLQEQLDKLEKLRDELNKYLPNRSPSPSPDAVTPLPKPVASSGFFITAHAEEEGKTTIEKLLDMDIHDIDIPLKKEIHGYEREMADIKYCINSADVTGLNDVGGISGRVGFRINIGANELNISTDGEDFSLNPSTAIKAVIESSINEGDITAKNNSAGGITGFSDLGKIKDSINYGDIEVTDGNYCGGITGYNLNEIMRCINTGDVNAECDIGGIAGYGKNISQTYSLTRTFSQGERIGAVAGTASGNLEHNYFLKEKLGGINGVDYNDKAQPVEKEAIARDGEIAGEMNGLDPQYWTAASGEKYMPQLRAMTENTAESDTLKAKSAAAAKFRFTVNFMVDGECIKSLNLDYGEVIPQEEVPQIPKIDGQYGKWDHDVNEAIIRNTDYTAEYNKSTSSLGYGGEPPQLLVEGDFRPDSLLEVNEFNPMAIVNDSRYEPLAGYEVKVIENGNVYDGRTKIHVRVPNEGKNIKIGIIKNNKIVIVDSVSDGSYFIFDPDGADRFIILKQKGSPVPFIIGGILLVGILCLLFIFRKRIKEKRLLNILKELKSKIKMPKFLSVDTEGEEETAEKDTVEEERRIEDGKEKEQECDTVC